MKHFNTYEYTISSHFAVAGVNADTSGMSDEDIKLMDDFDADLIKQHGNAHYIIEPHDQEPKFTRCDISGLMSDCYKIIIMVKK